MQYGRQLVSARRLARYERNLGKPEIQEESLSLRRKIMVERIAREIIENLIFSGSESSIVQEVRINLEKKLGEKLVFHYPPADMSFKIFRSKKDGELVEVNPEERDSIMDTLWKVTLETVDESTL